MSRRRAPVHAAPLAAAARCTLERGAFPCHDRRPDRGRVAGAHRGRGARLGARGDGGRAPSAGARPAVRCVLTIYAALLWRWPQRWLVAVPAALPSFDLAPWTGWMAVEESTSSCSSPSPVLALRRAAAAARFRASRDGAGVALACHAFAGAVGVARGLALAPFRREGRRSPTCAPTTRCASPRVFGIALALLPFLRRSFDERGDAARLLAVGMTAGLALVVAAALWERAVFTGIGTISTRPIASSRPSRACISAAAMSASMSRWHCRSCSRCWYASRPVQALLAAGIAVGRALHGRGHVRAHRLCERGHRHAWCWPWGRSRHGAATARRRRPTPHRRCFCSRSPPSSRSPRPIPGTCSTVSSRLVPDLAGARGAVVGRPGAAPRRRRDDAVRNGARHLCTHSFRRDAARRRARQCRARRGERPALCRARGGPAALCRSAGRGRFGPVLHVVLRLPLARGRGGRDPVREGDALFRGLHRP